MSSIISYLKGAMFMCKHNKKHKVISKDKQINKLRSINFVIFIIMAIVLTISIGYSSFNASLILLSSLASSALDSSFTLLSSYQPILSVELVKSMIL